MARAPGGLGLPGWEWDAAPGAGGGRAGRGSGREAPASGRGARSWTSWWARYPSTTRRRRSAATTAASGSALCSRTYWQPARAACSPTASTWVGGRRRPAGWARARRGGTARGLPPSLLPLRLRTLKFLKERNLGLPSSASQSAPWQMQLQRPLSGASLARGRGQPRPRERVGGALGALGGSAAVLGAGWGAAGHGGAGVRKSCRATRGRGV